MTSIETIREIIFNNREEIVGRFKDFDKTLGMIPMREIEPESDMDALIHFKFVQENFSNFLNEYDVNCVNASWRCFVLETKDTKSKEFLYYEGNTRYITCTKNELMSYLSLNRGIAEKHFQKDSMFIDDYAAKIHGACERFNVEITDDVIVKVEAKALNSIKSWLNW